MTLHTPINILLAFIILLTTACNDEATMRAQKQAHEQRLAQIQAEVAKERARLDARLAADKDWNDKKRKVAEVLAGVVAVAAFFGSVALTVVGLRNLGGRFLHRRRVLEARRDIALKAIDAARELALSMPPAERERVARRMTAAARNTDVLDIDFKLLAER